MPPKMAIGLSGPGSGRPRSISEANGFLTRTYTKQYDTENPLGRSWTDFFCTSPFGRVLIWWAVLLGVCICGGWLFIALERDNIDDQIKERNQYQDNVRLLLSSYNITEADTTSIFMQFEEIHSRRDTNPWNFSGAFYFCMSTALTIGWGTFTPTTAAGQWVLIPFSLIAMIAFLILLLEMLEANFLFIALLVKRYPKWGNTIKLLVSWGVLLVLLGAGIGYLMAHTHWNFRQALYFTWISITTIGYGDITPTVAPGEEGETWWTVIIVMCIPFIVADLTLIFDVYSKELQTEMRETLNRTQSWKKADDDDDDDARKDSMAGVVELQNEPMRLVM